jgi:hypothetical protein
MTQETDPRTGAVSLTLSGGAVVQVYPIGLRQLQEFDRLIGALAAVAGRAIQVDDKRPQAEQAAAVRDALQAALPALSMQAIGMAVRCTQAPEGVDLEAVPHWDLAAITDAWVCVNFGSPEKLQPWIALARRAIDLAAQGTKSATSQDS